MTTSAAWQAVVGSGDDVDQFVREYQLGMLENHPPQESPHVRFVRAVAITRKGWTVHPEPGALRLTDRHNEARVYVAFDDQGEYLWAAGDGQLVRAADHDDPLDVLAHWLGRLPARLPAKS